MKNLTYKLLIFMSANIAAQTSTTNPQEICYGSIKNYRVDSADGPNGTPGSIYQWSITPTDFSGTITGNNTNAISINWGNTPVGNYTLKVTELRNTCAAPPITLNIIINPKPEVPIITTDGTLNICEGTTSVLLSTTTQPNINYQWQLNGTNIPSNSTANSYVANTVGIYNVISTNNFGCTSSSSITITGADTVTYNGTWSSTPNQNSAVVISNDLLLNDNLKVCTCLINNNASVTVAENKTLSIEKNLTINAGSNLIISNNASLVQIDNNASNTGNVTIIRKSSPLEQYDYGYWSSPVTNQTLSVLGSPSVFYQFNPVIDNWSILPSSTIMVNGKGYISRVPNNLDFSTPQTIQINFAGKPNNGNIVVPILKSLTGYNLIGNPYPSAINIDQFILDANNTNLINGTVYLWTHNTPLTANNPGSTIYNYSSNDYAKYNLTGGVAAISGGQIPDEYIASGQGFFVEANDILSNGTYNLNLNNAMRVSNNNDNFFRHNDVTISENNSIEKNRFWISINNQNGAFNQLLVGYVSGATNEYDKHYDGKVIDTNNFVSIYSLSNDKKLSILGKQLPLSSNDTIVIGYKVRINGTFSIGLDNFDGAFTNIDIYLYDKLLSTYHNLKEGQYFFESEIGTFEDRFEIRYSNSILDINQPINFDDTIKVIYNNSEIIIHSEKKEITQASIYDVIGKLVFENSFNSVNEIKINNQNQSKILIVKIKLEDGIVITKKIIKT